MSKRIRTVFESKDYSKLKKYPEEYFKFKKLPYSKDDTYQLNKLLNKLSKSHPSREGWTKGIGRNNFGGVGFENDKRQRVMFKTLNSRSMIAHDRYLKTYMPQLDKEEVVDKPVLFGTSDDIYNAKKSAFHWKCIISPENQNIDLESYTRECLKRLETLTGYKFIWKAAIHKDKAHQHVHLCINGVDLNGNKVYFPREMIKKGIREVLSYVATEIMGERTPAEIEAAKSNMITANRWTPLDEQLKHYDTVSEHSLSPEAAARLYYLSEIKLANKLSNGQYKLKDDWEEILLATGRYNTYLDEYMKADEKPLELYSGGTVKGKVVKTITFDRDESWNDAVIVDCGEKRVYVPVYQLHKDNLNEKNIIINGGNRALSRQVKDNNIHIVD